MHSAPASWRKRSAGVGSLATVKSQQSLLRRPRDNDLYDFAGVEAWCWGIGFITSPRALYRGSAPSGASQ